MRSLYFGILLLTMTLSPAICRADESPRTENFQTLATSSKIAFSNSNHIGKTDFAIYNCTSGAVFGLDLFSGEYSGKISINFSGLNQVMTTSAIDGLARVNVYYRYKTSPKQIPHIDVQLSRDSIHWTDPIESDGMYSDGVVSASFVPGRYYVRLTNKGEGYKASIFEMEFHFGSCNCFLYIPE